MPFVQKKTYTEHYYEWICQFLGIRKRKYSHYKKLLRCLWTIPYNWINPDDENRYLDGVGLRSRFCFEMDMTDKQWKEFYMNVTNRCSVLEVLAAFSRRTVDKFSMSRFYGAYFWMIFMKNLDLLDMTDENFDENLVRETINSWLTCQFDSHGSGSILHLRSDEIDVSDTEMWTVMNYYMREHPELEEID